MNNQNLIFYYDDSGNIPINEQVLTNTEVLICIGTVIIPLIVVALLLWWSTKDL